MDVDDFDDVSGYIDDSETLPVEGMSAFARQLRFSEEGIAAAAEIVSLIVASDGADVDEGRRSNASINNDGESISNLTENNIAEGIRSSTNESIISTLQGGASGAGTVGGGGSGNGGANASNANEPETPIEVYARVRPLNSEERGRGASGVSTLRIEDDRTVITTAPPVSLFFPRCCVRGLH